ncbi:MAG TPA: hypothetical protein VD840_08015 [Sinorhizobium sp.]|nr:hypothetical protein [Sinorhizobium sp.]
MLQQIFLTTIALPLAMGAVISLLGKGKSATAVALTALLVPVAAAIASVAIEGLPPLPPVAAKQKFPLVLLAGGIVFAPLGLTLKQWPSRVVGALAGVISLAAPAWWLGRNVLAANPVKAATLGAVLLIVAIVLPLVSAKRSPTADGVPPAAMPAALLWVAIATALCAIFGGYIGMAQMNGALAALVGGWLLVRYIGYLRGDDEAFALKGIAAFAFVWTAAAALAMTVLFAPSAAPAALVLASLPLAAALVLSSRRIAFASQPRALRPLATGVATAVPAALAILIAALLQA